jgi:pilus assembly protein CpaE
MVSISDPIEAERAAADLRRFVPGLPVTGVANYADPDTLLIAMRAGFPDLLSPPFRTEAIAENLFRIRTQLSGHSALAEGTPLVYSFLPAKPGVGTTTIAVNAAIAAARCVADPVFLGDFDLSMGVVRFMLQLENEYSVVDAASADGIEDRQWPRLVCRKFGVDFMHAGRLQPDTRMAPIQAMQLIAYLRRPYRIVCADLSGNFEKYSIEIMRQSKRIFLVTTPELPSLFLARDRIAFLRSLELTDKITLLLNRTVRRGPEEKDIAELLGVPVFRSFVNDYATVSDAVQEARPVKEGSEFGSQIAEFARLLPDENSIQRPEPAKKFLEFFTLKPHRARV